MSNNIVLEIKDLTKKIGNRQIINNVSLNLYKGDILGFIGPNGAGKTTIIKLILGLQKYNNGNIKICGNDLKKEFTKAISNVGAIIENPDMYMYLSGYENLEIAAKLYQIPKERIIEVAKLVGLEEKIYDKVKKYSLGMRQRLGIAQAIIHNPKILILDEPTNGLDPEGIKDLKVLLKEIVSKQEIAIIISSHLLSEIDNLCNRICILANGKIIKDEKVGEIKKIIGVSNYILEVNKTSLQDIIPNYHIIDNNHIKINTNKENLNNILKILLSNNIEIYEIKKDIMSLEDIFLKITKEENNA